MKKILSLILIVTLVLSLGMVGFATTVEPTGFDDAGNKYGDQNDADWTNVKFKKSITTIGNDGAKHPAETFGFTVSPVSAVDEQGVAIATIPVFDPATFNITAAEGAGEGFVTVELPEFTQIGTYVYEVEESVSNTAGMVIDSNKYTFTVIVLNDGQGQLKRLVLKDENGQKQMFFENKYDAGSLVVNKEITGNNANFAETFPVKVTLTAPTDKVIQSTISVAGALANPGVTQTGNGTNEVVIEFEVTNNSNVTISNIPYGVTYIVEETNLKNYTATYDDNKTGSIGAASISTKIINDLSRDIATGINLDNIPYIILLVGAAIGIVALVVRRRKNFEY